MQNVMTAPRRGVNGNKTFLETTKEMLERPEDELEAQNDGQHNETGSIKKSNCSAPQTKSAGSFLRYISAIVDEGLSEDLFPNLAVDIRVEQFSAPRDISTPVETRNVEDALAFVDDSLHVPMVLLHLGRRYRLKVRLWCKPGSSLEDYVIKSILVRSADEQPEDAIELELKQDTGEKYTHAVVSLFDPQRSYPTRFFLPTGLSRVESSQHLVLEFKVLVGLKSTGEQDLFAKATVLYRLVKSKQKMEAVQKAQECERVWYKTPNFMEDKANAAVILKKVRQAKKVGVEHLSFLGRVFHILQKLFVLDCTSM